MFTEPQDCLFLNDLCLRHKARRMFQFFSLKLVENPVDGLLQLYGYIVVREQVDPFLNYVVNFTRDDPIIVEQVHTHTYLQITSRTESNSPKFVYLTRSSIELGIWPHKVFNIVFNPWCQFGRGGFHTYFRFYEQLLYQVLH